MIGLQIVDSNKNPISTEIVFKGTILPKIQKAKILIE